MYLPGFFEITEPARLHALIRAHPLGAIVVHGAEGLTADHIPLQLSVPEGAPAFLEGHVARANPLWRRAAEGPMDCLVLFQGADHYISPGWYATKAEHGRVVPTWNYEVVHVRGRLCALDDAEWLRRFLARLTDSHEAGQAAPWRMTDAPADYVDRLLQAIVGIRIEVLGFQGKAKLSQNQPEQNQPTIRRGLESQDTPQAEAMLGAMNALPAKPTSP